MAYVNPILLAQREVLRKLRDDYTITRVVRVSDGGGGFTDGTPTTLTGKCSFSLMGGRTEEVERVQQRGDYRLKVLATADISYEDTIVVFGREFRIVWTPPVKALAMTRTIGLVEVGSGS